MSNSNSTLYPNMPVDRDAAVNLIHGLQVDLSLLAAMLAREPDTHWHYAGMAKLVLLQENIRHFIPELRRQ